MPVSRKLPNTIINGRCVKLNIANAWQKMIVDQFIFHFSLFYYHNLISINKMVFKYKYKSIAKFCNMILYITYTLLTYI
jgi:hypothetical protein